jgi:hypothetical protein
MAEAIALIILAQHTPLADSRAIAQALGVTHDAFLDHVTAYQREIERRFGLVRFEIAEDTVDYYALLTEDQAQVYLSYSPERRAKTYKQTLARAFARAIEQEDVPYEHEEAQFVAWMLFFAQWHALFGDQAISIKTLKERLHASPSFANILPEPLNAAFLLPQPASFAVRLGKALTKRKGIPLGPRGWMLQQEYDAHRKSFRWRVVTTK